MAEWQIQSSEHEQVTHNELYQYQYINCEIDFDQVKTMEDLKDVIKALGITITLNKYDQTTDAYALYTRSILVEKRIK